MQRISNAVAKWLLKAGAISADSVELYAYAVYSFLFTLVPLLVVLIIGIVLQMPLEGVLLILPFMLLRKFSGGFHLSSPVVCIVSSTVLLTAFLLLTRLICDSGVFAPFAVAVAASLAVILTQSPIDSEARSLSEKETVFFRKIAIWVSLLIAALCAVLLFLKLPRFAVPIGFGLILTALLQLPCLFGRLKKHE